MIKCMEHTAQEPLQACLLADCSLFAHCSLAARSLVVCCSLAARSLLTKLTPFCIALCLCAKSGHVRETRKQAGRHASLSHVSMLLAMCCSDAVVTY